MKTKALKYTVLAAISLLFVLPSFSQKGIEDGSKYGKGEDSINCIKNLSLYKEFFKHNNYGDAINPWRRVFGECPASSEKMYVEGVTMYKNFIESSPSPERTEQMVDTLMLIYERRIEYYPKNKGSILGRKGIDLLRYSRTDIEAVEQAYGYLKESIDIEQSKSRDAVLVTYMNAGITLNKADKIDDNQVIEDYFLVTTIIDKLLAKSSRWGKAKKNVDDLMLNSGLLTCDALNSYFEPQFEINKEDQVFLEKLINFYTATGCDRTDLYVAASEQMYVIEPGPKSAHQLARLFMIRSDYPKAASYLKEAVGGTDVDAETKAEWYFELAIVTRAQEKYCEAITYAREAITLKSNYGAAYILIGDCYIFSRDKLGDDFQQRAAYWAAAYKYGKAKAVDPSVSAEATKKINDYSGQYPNHEEVFFRDMKDGDSYEVKGCINEYTTVRSRK
ncbi:MAG: tetratricopeptide repeat protein [Bacteroides sp.]|nr:tetratricopeptide repeat protein [Bacteroides sp.]